MYAMSINKIVGTTWDFRFCEHPYNIQIGYRILEILEREICMEKILDFLCLFSSQIYGQ